MKLYYQQPGTAAEEIKELCEIAHEMAVAIDELSKNEEYMQSLVDEIEQAKKDIEN